LLPDSRLFLPLFFPLFFFSLFPFSVVTQEEVSGGQILTPCALSFFPLSHPRQTYRRSGILQDENEFAPRVMLGRVLFFFSSLLFPLPFLPLLPRTGGVADVSPSRTMRPTESTFSFPFLPFSFFPPPPPFFLRRGGRRKTESCLLLVRPPLFFPFFSFFFPFFSFFPTNGLGDLEIAVSNRKGELLLFDAAVPPFFLPSFFPLPPPTDTCGLT